MICFLVGALCLVGGVGAGLYLGARRGASREPALLLHPNNVNVRTGQGHGGLFLTLEFAHLDEVTGGPSAASAFDISSTTGARLRDELTFQLDAIAEGEPFERGRDVPLEPGEGSEP